MAHALVTHSARTYNTAVLHMAFWDTPWTKTRVNHQHLCHDSRDNLPTKT